MATTPSMRCAQFSAPSSQKKSPPTPPSPRNVQPATARSTRIEPPQRRNCLEFIIKRRFYSTFYLISIPPKKGGREKGYSHGKSERPAGGGARRAYLGSSLSSV